MFTPLLATPFDSDAPLGDRRAVIRRAEDRDEVEMVELTWGLEPIEAGVRSFRFVRSEGRKFPTHRCLVPASELHCTRDGRPYRFKLEDGNWFYLAGIWRPATAGWPDFYAILTVAANPEVARYQDRQGAVLLRRQRMAWLDGTESEGELLRPSPARSFDVEHILDSDATQPMLAL